VNLRLARGTDFANKGELEEDKPLVPLFDLQFLNEVGLPGPGNFKSAA
jgi:hypothetical protein